MNKILCSTGALLPYGGDYRQLEMLSRQLTCDGYEFMMDAPYYKEAEALKQFFQQSGLYTPILHCEKGIGESIGQGGDAQWADALEKFEINCDIARSIGAEKMVLHLWNGIPSDSKFQNNLNGYRYLDAIARRYGIGLLVENVVCTVRNPMGRLCQLRERYPEIRFVFDTKMAAFHGQLDSLYDPEYAWLWQDGYLAHYHVNDYAGGYMDWENLRPLPIGKGNLDFTRFFEFVNRTGYAGSFTTEATAYGSRAFQPEMLNGQFQYIRDHLK